MAFRFIPQQLPQKMSSKSSNQIRPFIVFGLAVMFGLGGCAGPSLKVGALSKPQSKVEKVIYNSSALTDASVGSLKADGLFELYRSEPDKAIRRAWELQKKGSTPRRKAALAEMSLDQGMSLEKKDPLRALGSYLDAAQFSVQESTSVKGTERSESAIIHRRAVSGVVGVIHANPELVDSKASVAGVQGVHRFSIAEGGRYVSPSRFALLVPTERLTLKGMKLRSVTQDGAGVAMLGKELPDHRQLLSNPFIPRGGYGYPLNARIEFSGTSSKLALQDLMLGSNARINGKSVPLESDFSAAIASYFDEHTDHYSGFKAMIRPGNFDQRAGLITIEPFRKNKIPLFLVHGLQSKAEAWVHLANRLRAAPFIRERYQIILFNYPTGNPVAKNAADLRDALADFKKLYDPQGRNPYLKQSVIAGHSMGGVISNMQIRTSGSKVYDALFKKNLDEVKMGAKQKNEAQRRLFFKANPDIDRVILIAAPLRGSSFASNPIGKLGSFLIKLPFDLAGSVLDQIDVADVMTGGAGDAFARPRNSITSLRSDDPVLAAVLTLPVRQGVKIHSIIAQANDKAPRAEGTDRIVRYSSSHLEGVESEKIVLNANHTSVLRNDECLTEMWRILQKHLRSFDN